MSDQRTFASHNPPPRSPDTSASLPTLLYMMLIQMIIRDSCFELQMILKKCINKRNYSIKKSNRTRCEWIYPLVILWGVHDHNSADRSLNMPQHAADTSSCAQGLTNQFTPQDRLRWANMWSQRASLLMPNPLAHLKSPKLVTSFQDRDQYFKTMKWFDVVLIPECKCSISAPPSSPICLGF